MGFENNFNGIYFHHHFYLKTGVSRNGLSPGYSERDTSSVSTYKLTIILIFFPGKKIIINQNLNHKYHELVFQLKMYFSEDFA